MGTLRRRRMDSLTRTAVEQYLEMRNTSDVSNRYWEGWLAGARHILMQIGVPVTEFRPELKRRE